MYLLSCWTLLFAVLWGVFGAFGVSDGGEAVPPLSYPPVPAELGAAHPLPLPSALGMAEPEGSVRVAAPGVPVYPIYPIYPVYPVYPTYLCIAAGTRVGCAGTHPITGHALLGRPKPCPVLPEILKGSERRPVPAPGGSSARPLPGALPGRCHRSPIPGAVGTVPVGP